MKFGMMNKGQEIIDEAQELIKIKNTKSPIYIKNKVLLNLINKRIKELEKQFEDL